ncbi:hypothetical protein [Brevundimonas aurifodinae]|uniref:Amino acid transporter n=1 Tax=Brevundimonas aurifodinae TaxID=1508312 RepID=A0ABV1NM74_9CAUL|nr:MAG: hypothetical protein B7Z42_03285 [Brevundimonas sp. 12-68-7]
MSEAFDPRPITKAAKNERRKLLATTINTVGLTVFAVGFITPMLAGGLTRSSALTLGASFAILAMSHLIARRLLRGLED